MALPGISAVIADGRLRITPDQSGTKLTILGTSTNSNLPLYEPVAVTNGKLAIAALEHTSGDPSELSLALEEALMAGAQNIEAVCIAHESGEQSAFTANSRWDGHYQAFDALRAHEVDVVYLAGAYIDETGLSGTDTGGASRDNFGKQLADFCYRATVGEGNSCIGVIGTKPINEVARDESWASAPSSTGDVIFDSPTRAHVNEWVYHLIGDASSGEIDHSSEILTSSGFLAGSDESAPGALSGSYDFWARDDDETIGTDNFGTQIDGGGYISVVAGACRIAGPSTRKLAAKYEKTSATTRNTNGAGSYAGFITTLPPQVGSTNKVIPGLSSARELKRSQALNILNHRMVTWITRPLGYVVVKGVTGAYNASDFTRSDFTMLTTIRITHACLDIVTRAAEPFIGYPNNEVNQNAMRSAIDSGLHSFQKEGALQAFDFRLESPPNIQVLGKANVYLTIVPAFELTEVTVYINLAKEINA